MVGVGPNRQTPSYILLEEYKKEKMRVDARKRQSNFENYPKKKMIRESCKSASERESNRK